MFGIYSSIRNYFGGIKYHCIQKRYPIPKVLSRLETSRLIATGKYSISRYGDGELNMVLDNGSIGFQHYDEGLSKRLGEILKAEQDERILVCLPDVFVSVSYMRKSPEQFWLGWVNQHRAMLSSYAKWSQEIYGDTNVTRLYMAWKDRSKEQEILDNLMCAWKDKTVILVEGTQTRWGVGNQLLSEAAQVHRILCPSKNAFAKYDEILKACLACNYDNAVYILALGPTATVLAYDLAKQGRIALDLGHLDLQLEYLLRQAEERIAIDGKYNNEIGGMVGNTEISDPQYQSQILCTIS